MSIEYQLLYGYQDPPLYQQIDNLLQLQESLIDFAQPSLDSSIWTKGKGGSFRLRLSVEKAILDHLGKHPGIDLRVATKEPHVVGSMTSNQYLDNSDLDVHLFPVNPAEWDEDKARGVKAWFEDPKNLLRIAGHPLEVFVQMHPPTDYLSPGFYDIESRKWKKGPKIVPSNYDPYEDFSDLADDLRATVKDADNLFSEIRRDIIDVDIMQNAIEKMSSEDRKIFLAKLEAKLKEIEADIASLVDIKKSWVQARRVTEPATPEEALKDVELAKEWRDANGLFKLVGRYQYIYLIKALRNLVADDGELSADEIDKIKNVLGSPK